MEAIEKTRELINFFDVKPNWTIYEQEDAEDIAVYVDFENSSYLLNPSVFLSQNNDIYQPFKISIKSVRLRAQKELDLQTFAYLDYKKAGIFRNSIEVGLKEEDLTLEQIDAEIVSGVSFLFLQKSMSFLPLIRFIITLNAEDIVKTTERLTKST
ncbi:MAG TPA: hypothetical protein PKI00_01785 [Candidatus Pacearchaeota archaeon]|nr:hypothetical protein [Candidatus Pacearchaeota archaeon]HOC53951.1 hypothetical protein [Candidatus Pacearchaeota archaeon]